MAGSATGQAAAADGNNQALEPEITTEYKAQVVLEAENEHHDALTDSGCSHTCVSENFICRHHKYRN